VQEYDGGKAKYSLQKEANRTKQNMTQETTAQNIKNQLKSSIEKEEMEEIKRKLINGQFYRDL
jgi:hypothetical protein